MKTKFKSILVCSLFSALSSTGVYAQATNNAYGDNQIEVEPGVFAIYSGDINQDNNIDIFDAPALEADIFSFAFGYLPTDINGDGNVDIFDQPIVEANIFAFVYSVKP